MITLPQGSYSMTDLPEHVKLGKYSSIAADVKIHSPNDNHQCVFNKKCVYTTNWDQIDTHQNIVIGSDVWICEGVRILPDVHIGDGAIIGAGAVISRDVPPFAVVVGNPQQITRFRFDKEIMAKLLKIKWWNFTEEKVEKLKPFMKDVDVFLTKVEEYK